MEKNNKSDSLKVNSIYIVNNKDEISRVDSIFLDNYGSIYTTGTVYADVYNDKEETLDTNIYGYIIKLNKNGTLDTTFGNNGKIIINNITNKINNTKLTAESIYVDKKGYVYTTGSIFDKFDKAKSKAYVIKLK
ncbi:MAG: hypothetical protein N2485_04605 [bacterium]|nr:hypothetical protein [bacterium]